MTERRSRSGTAQGVRREAGGGRPRPRRRTRARSSLCSGPTAPARPRPSRSSRATAARRRRGPGARRRPGSTRPRTGGAGSASCCRAPASSTSCGSRRWCASSPGTTRTPTTRPPCIDRVGLTEKRRALTHTLSGGQKRRLDVALGVIGRPELLFLDEPTTGFDPRGAARVLGADPRSGPGRHDDRADHALPGGGRGAGRPGRGHRRRPADRRRPAGRARRPRPRSRPG